MQPSTEQATQLHSYLDLLSKWNSVYNLTAIRDRSEMLRRHVEDCLSCVEPILKRWPPERACRLLDVGSGGGLPGVIIAIMLPNVEVTCIDAVGKKAAFIQQVASTLTVANLKAVHVRAEDMGGSFDIITARAFSTLRHFIDVTKHSLATEGSWLAMKGVVPYDELDELDPADVTFHVEQPEDVEGQHRCLVWIERSEHAKSALACAE